MTNDVLDLPTELVLAEVRGSTGVITLNRPKALNALNREMVLAITAALEAWADDPAIDQVVVYSTAKHFCSGGDMRFLRDETNAGRSEAIEEFLEPEYRMNALIANYPKPYVALMNGIVMGGGAGISVYGSHRVITPRTALSMPESKIGFVNDVGMSHVLQNLPGHESVGLGIYLGLTGYRLTAADLMEVGLGTHLVESLDGLLDEIVASGLGAIEARAIEPEKSSLPEIYDQVDRVFAAPWPEIEQNLGELEPDLRASVDEMLIGASPTSLVTSAEAFLANQGKDLVDASENERVLGGFIGRHNDFDEGVRAVLVDKSGDAKFSERVDPEIIRALLDDRESRLGLEKYRK